MVRHEEQNLQALESIYKVKIKEKGVEGKVPLDYLSVGHFRKIPMPKKVYPSDLSDAEWRLIEPLILPPKTSGHPRTTKMRQVCNAIFYLLKTGCQWAYCPEDFPLRLS